MPGRGRKKGKYDFIPETYEEEQTQDGEFQDEADFPDASGSPRLTDGETWPDPAEQEEGFRNPGDGEEESEAPEEEPPEKHSIFRPETRKPNFVLSVAVNVVRVTALLILLAGLAGIGAVLGIAKGYVETAVGVDILFNT